MTNFTGSFSSHLETELISRPFVVTFLESCILMFINGLAFVGNTIVVIAFVRSPFLRELTGNIFIVALAISDIITSLLPMPLSFGVLISGKWLYGNFLCLLQGFLVHFLAFVSLQLMALTALSRYYKTLRPFRVMKVFNHRYTICMITGACLFSCAILVSTLFPQPSQSFVFHPGKVICVRLYSSILMSRINTAGLSLIFVILPAVIIITCYTKVLRELLRHNRMVQSESTQHREALGTSQPSLEMQRSVQMRNVQAMITRTLVITVIGFFLCWVPCFVIDFADVLLDGYMDRRAYLAYTYLAYASSAINPVVYGIHNPAFRRGFLNFIK